MEGGLVTVNDQLRRASGRIKNEINDVPIPVLFSSVHRRLPLALGGVLVAIFTMVALAWLSPFGRQPGPFFVNPVSGDVPMVRQWLEGALAGRFDDIAALTYGEFGEPEAMAQFAQALHGYQAQYGEPVVTVTPFETSGGDLAFTCIAVDFSTFQIRGGIVVREWPDQGRRLWEFRNAMIGCAGEESVTTTLPPLPTEVTPIDP
jgi:hypothetical protein